ncbi:hypothetical protein IAI10_16525 [Clostridium sp. 19966]|uniref:hypothetical protein n=1 Tax=Clostridium sp. 19966 TaxID=2768166 RepID=UPI0028E06B9B|nr:hypothetical protein [Clostridium sp. 19966]MDT8718274.1 hypothetical protein [Clostridium sp. 19966]
MKSFKKKSFILALSMLMVFGTSMSTFAQTNSNDNKSLNSYNTNGALTANISSNSSNQIVITDKKQLSSEAKHLNIPLTKNGKTLKKIELINQPVTNQTQSSIIQNKTKGTITPNSWDTLYYYIKSTTNYGSGWYDSTDDLMWDLWWDGPDTAVVSHTESISASVSDTLGVSESGISASVGFNVAGSYSVTFSSTTPVPSGETLNVKVYRTFQKVSFEVWEDNAFEANKYYGTGYAYKPNGAYFAKSWYY